MLAANNLGPPQSPPQELPVYLTPSAAQALAKSDVSFSGWIPNTGTSNHKAQAQFHALLIRRAEREMKMIHERKRKEKRMTYFRVAGYT